MNKQQLRAIPNTQRLLEQEAIAALSQKYFRDEVVSALRSQLEFVREQILTNPDYVVPDFFDDCFADVVEKEIKNGKERSLKLVINATGIILHTNLGRAPMAEYAIDAAREAALGYSNLEFNLASGKRGSRYMHIEDLLKKITGAEAAVVVNNCAAAVLVSLNTLSIGKELLVSRGELIEIGGGFRMPDVIAATGAIMKEVGTTNKTRISDFENAITEDTRVILRNHCSNFKVVGFTESPALKELVELAHSKGIYMVDDLGSGSLIDLTQFGVSGERTVQQIVCDGVDAVMFSGDKLLGGPQAGIIVGKAGVIAAIKKNPLLRAMRIDKISLAVLEATLGLYLFPKLALSRIPVLRMISEDKSSVQKRAKTLLKKLAKQESIKVCLEDGTSFIGGGSAPMNELETCVIKIESEVFSVEKIARTLRNHRPAVIGRISDNAFVIDLRTVLPEQTKFITKALGSLG
ncbi:MAG: L-seryl-tRNA(Sec) selenium transferase [Arenicellaceae bacterium]|nr:L-seryl-tRNA(Sec) selenium transferase [Arenicellaceae bacterium]